MKNLAFNLGFWPGQWNPHFQNGNAQI